MIVPAAHSATSTGYAQQTAAVTQEMARLYAALRREVPQLIIDSPGRARAWIAEARAEVAASGYSIDGPQLLVVVDRNPAIQQMRIILALPAGPWLSLGGTRVSTGQPGRYGYFTTPTGVFLHETANLDWRAEGTFNEHHIRGLGIKGMRVWDFGWQQARRGWGPPGQKSDMRLLMHATDPTYLEARLGHMASKGCVRIPDAMNRFLDRHGVLDRDYERAAETDGYIQALLSPDHIFTPLAGDKFVIIDSSRPVPLRMAGD